jgi:hypothetical protein
MIGDGRPPAPESWDEANDYRRFWWMVPPVFFVALTTAVMLILEATVPSYSGRASIEQSLERTFEPHAPVEVTVQVPRGSITVEPRETDTVSIEVRKTARSPSEDLARAALEDLHVRFVATDAGVQLILAYRSGSTRSATAEIDVIVPLRAVIDVETLSGDIDIRLAESGNYRLGTADGDIDVDLEPEKGAHIAVDARAFVANFAVQKEQQSGSLSDIYRTAPQIAAQIFIDLRAPNGRVRLNSR